ncbi:MAG TPA: zinc permease, partial [Acidimicrobiia bacterium]
MSIEKTLLLGFIAGVTILLGLPIARLKRPAPNLRIMLNAVAVGILIFLVWDVLSAAWAPIDADLSSFHKGNGGLGGAFGYGVLFAGALAVGLLSMIAYEHWMGRRTRRPDANVVDPPEMSPSPANTATKTLARGATGL